jgi:hypothetical protein
VIDISPIENVLVDTGATVLTGVGTWLIGAVALWLQRRAGWIGAQRIGQMRDMADDVWGHAVASARTELAKQLPDSVDPHSFVSKMAVQYAVDHDKALLADAGIDVADPNALTQKAEAMIAKLAPDILPVPGASKPAPKAAAAAAASPPAPAKPIDLRDPAQSASL